MRWDVKVEKLKVDCPECHRHKLAAVWVNGSLDAYYCAACREQFGAMHRIQERNDGGLEVVEMAQPLKDKSKTYDLGTAPVPEA
jgi:hypothetical protein